MKNILLRNLTGEKYLLCFFACIIGLCTLLGTVMYAVDPWLYYRIDPNNDYWLYGAYTAPGVIKNKEYNAAVIGSSYFQDFRMQWFMDKLKVEPANITAPGLDNNETVMLTNALIREGKVDTLYICLTPYSFMSDQHKDRIPAYLLDATPLNDYRYLFAYEAWTKFLPLDAATFILNNLNVHALDKYKSLRDVDLLGNELSRFTFSAETVWKQNMNWVASTSYTESDNENRLNNMKLNFKGYLDALNISESPNVEYIFILPPHSALYWQHLQASGSYNLFLSFIRNISEQLDQLENVQLVDCLSMDEIINLDHYRDTTHFDLTVQEKIVDRVASGEYRLTPSNTDSQLEKLSRLVDRFIVENAEKLKK